MSKKIVENRDQELVRKFRSVVHLKEQQRRKTRTVFWIAGALAAAMAVFGLFDGSLFREPATVMPPNAMVRGGSDTTADPALPGPAATGGSSKSAEVAGSAAWSQAPLPETGGESRPALPVKESRFKRPKQVIGEVQVGKIVACKRVEDRRFVSPQTEFSLRTDARPDIWIWMEVQTGQQALPCRVKHVYFHNGRRHMEVPLTIRLPRMRTWSHVTLNGPEHVGRWRVDVVTDAGEILSHVDFTVVDS